MTWHRPDNEATLMIAAAQQLQGTIAPAYAPRPAPSVVAVAYQPAANAMQAQAILSSMTVSLPSAKPRVFCIQGVTLDGRSFRPSDWAERLASAMACFRPGAGAGGIGAFIGYSPYCVPTVEDNVKAVLVNEALRDLEPMAWDFVMNFARDNALRMTEVGEPPAQK